MTKIAYVKERTPRRETKQPMIPSMQAAPITPVSREDSLSWDVVRQKIAEAVEFTKSTEQKRYEAEISDLKFKLDIASKRVIELEQSLITSGSFDKISNLEEKLDRLYNKIADGSISPLVGSHMDRPTLEDQIFIDPLEKDAGNQLESHIEIKDEAASKSDRNVAADVSKLRSLLKK